MQRSPLAARAYGGHNPRKEPLHSNDRPDAGSTAISATGFGAGGDNFREQWGQRVRRKSKCVVYLAFSRGEVAERLKAAVC
jgi:hypothetical protein